MSSKKLQIAFPQRRCNKWCMAGSKHRWIAADDRGNSGMMSELVFQKFADMLPIPTPRMLEAPVKKHVTCVKGRRIQRIYLWTKGRQIEYGQV